MSITRKIMLIFYLFGIFMGIIFPFYAIIFVDFKAGKTIYFVIGCLLAGFMIGVFNFYIYRRIVGRIITLLSDTFYSLAKGNLSHQLVIESNDEFGQMAKSFEIMRTNLNASLNNIHENADQLGNTSKILAFSAQETKSTSDKVAQKIREVADGANKQAEYNSTVVQLVNHMEQESAESYAQINRLVRQSSETTQLANEGKIAILQAIDNLGVITETISSASSSIQRLGERSKEISGIVEIITEIANQTGLLALNAAIEAARAGEHGRGFSIVASEVRKLAQSSNIAANQIKQLISTVLQETTEQITAMDIDLQKVSKQIDIIQTGGSAVSTIVQQVTATEKIAYEVQQKLDRLRTDSIHIKNSMIEISGIIEQTAENSEEVARTANQQFQIVNQVAESSAHIAGMSEKLLQEFTKFESS